MLGALAGLDHGHDAPSTNTPALSVDYGPCQSIDFGDVPTCRFDGEHLHLWVDHPAAEQAVVWLDGQPAAPSRYQYDELSGTGFRLSIPGGAEQVVVGIETERREWIRWTLRLSDDAPPADSRQQRSSIRDHLDAEHYDQALERLAALREALPQSSESLDAALTVAYYLARSPDGLPRAEALMHEVRDLADRSSAGRARWADRSGQLHWMRGRLDDAAMAYREAGQYALRTRDEPLAIGALSMYAYLLAELGYLRAAEHWARYVHRQVDQLSLPPAMIGSLLRTIGWTGLLLREAGHTQFDPRPPYRQALAIFGPDGAAQDPTRVGGVHLGLARLGLSTREPDAAMEQLDRIEPTRVTLDELVHATSLRIEAMLQQGIRASTIESHLEHLRQLVEQADTPHTRWQLAMLRGRLAQARGRTEAAIEHYHHAEQLQDQALRLAVFGAGRSMLGSLGDEATRRLISIFVEHGRHHEALCSARSYRARANRALVFPDASRRDLEDQAAAYIRLEQQIDDLERAGEQTPGRQLQRIRAEAKQQRRALAQRSAELLMIRGRLASDSTCADLSPPAPGELMVGIVPMGAQWLVLAEAGDEGDTRAFRIAAPDPASTSPVVPAASLFGPLRPMLARAKRVRVHAAGQALRLDVHMLPFEGARLIERMPVSYGAELPFAEASRDVHRSALLVADPTESLREASLEVQLVHGQLRAAGWSARRAADPGSLPTMLDELSAVDLFHYAGHADAATPDDRVALWPPYAGGSPVWPSYLELAPPTRLGVAELLTLSSAPRWVVLNGCRTGITDVKHAGTSLALAFLAAGSEQVLASTVTTDDRTDAEIGRQIYEGLSEDEPLDLAWQLHRVMQARARAGLPLGHFRVWVR